MQVASGHILPYAERSCFTSRDGDAYAVALQEALCLYPHMCTTVASMRQPPHPGYWQRGPAAAHWEQGMTPRRWRVACASDTPHASLRSVACPLRKGYVPYPDKHEDLRAMGTLAADPLCVSPRVQCGAQGALIPAMA